MIFSIQESFVALKLSLCYTCMQTLEARCYNEIGES